LASSAEQASPQAEQTVAQSAQWPYRMPCEAQAFAQARQNAMQLASCASMRWRCPLFSYRKSTLAVALHAAAQSRLSRMHATRSELRRSDRQASAQAVHSPTQVKHASMQRITISDWGDLLREEDIRASTSRHRQWLLTKFCNSY
jgi:hypothetical protein